LNGALPCQLMKYELYWLCCESLKLNWP
jgi:hypothetical protein